MKTRNTIKSILATTLIATSLTTAVQANDLLKADIKVKKVNEKDNILNEMKELPIFKQAKLTPIKFVETNGLYYVTIRTQQAQEASVFVSKDLKLLIHSGKGVSTKDGMEYTPPITISEFDDLVSFKYGKGEKTLYVFTDPECPFCKKFESNWEKLKDKYTLKVFLLPLDMHKKAPEMNHWILNAETDEEKAARLIEIANGSEKYSGFMKTETVEEYKKIEEKTKKIKEAAGSAGISGTPTVINEKGERINWTQL